MADSLIPSRRSFARVPFLLVALPRLRVSILRPFDFPLFQSATVEPFPASMRTKGSKSRPDPILPLSAKAKEWKMYVLDLSRFW
jgi:hypothetical protein